MIIMVMLSAIAAGFLQGLTGFGAGIIMMLVIPSYFPLHQSAGISTAIGMILSISMVYHYRKHISIKKAVLPAILFITICTIVIPYSSSFDQVIMKKIFGVFLICLSLYYLFINKPTEKEMPIYIKLLCIVISALCDSLFGIGGPLMVLYFLDNTDDTKEYFGTIQTFFLINSAYNTSLRVFKGIILPEHFLYILLGALSIIIGLQIANKLVDKLNTSNVKKLVYLVIGFSGLVNLIF